MSYTKQNFIKGQILKADHLNTMETGIEANDLAIAALSEENAEIKAEIEALRPVATTIATELGHYDAGQNFALVGVKMKQGIHTELLSVRGVQYARMAKDFPTTGMGTMYVTYFDLSQNPVMQKTAARSTGSNLLETIEYPYFSVSWYWKQGVAEETEFLSYLDISIKDETSAIQHNVNERKFAFPRWAEIHPWIAFNGVTMAEIEGDLGFSGWYNKFHALTETYSAVGLEEINMSTDYLAANADDAVPDAIAGLTNGGMYMWHLPAPADDGSPLVPGHLVPKILLVSGIHGDEKNSVWGLWKLLDALCKNDAEHRAITLLRNFCDIYIVPLANPYGLQQGPRANENGIDINRDFAVRNWAYDSSTSIYPTEPNSQYSTRCMAWWMGKIAPHMMIDFHRSEGNSESESGMFIQWGTSAYKSILTLIDENIMDVTPYVRKNLAPKFDAYHHRFGHAKEILGTGITNGTSALYAAELGIPSATYEVVRRVKWGGVDVLTTDNADEVCAMNYHGMVNFIAKFAQYTVDMLNDGVDWAASIDW